MADLKQFERKMEKTLEVLASDFGQSAQAEPTRRSSTGLR